MSTSTSTTTTTIRGALIFGLGLAACAATERDRFDVPIAAAPTDGADGATAVTPPPEITPVVDAATPTDAPLQECAATRVEAELVPLPADIVWVIDNSRSMADEIEAVRGGINAFTTQLAGSGIDYHLVMLSKRGTETTTALSPICVPEPLAGPDCGNTERFFHADFPQEGIKSVQPLEQLLGSLAQTACYKAGDSGGRGGNPWRDSLREGASKSIVVVSDDNSRLSSNAFLHTPGGAVSTISGGSANCTLPPGLLQPSWNGLFDHLTVHAMVGVGGATYHELAEQTGGVVANIAEAGGAQSAAWAAFFDAVAAQVVTAANVSCSLPMPTAPEGQTLDPNKVNVAISTGQDAGSDTLGRVSTAADCTTSGGWFYDDPSAPTGVELCPASCAALNAGADAKSRSVDVLFGCDTVVTVH